MVLAIGDNYVAYEAAWKDSFFSVVIWNQQGQIGQFYVPGSFNGSGFNWGCPGQAGGRGRRLAVGFLKAMTDVGSFRSQGLMGFFQFVEGNGRIAGVDPVVTFVVFEKVVESGDQDGEPPLIEPGGGG